MKWKSSFLAVALATACVAQTPQVESAEVDRVGSHIACQCGGCKESVSCPMSKRGCSFCAPAKAKIYKMQQAGMSDEAILASYKQQYGDKIYLSDPSAAYWAVPAMVLLFGLGAIFWFVRRYAQPRNAVPAHAADPALSRFQEEIDRETAEME